jgi:predicted CopG family antitoxin
MSQIELKQPKTVKYINYMDLTYHMTTTISISEELKSKLRNLGRAGDSYEEVITRMYEISKKNMLLSYLYDASDSISIDEAIARAKAKWQK